jgi:transaldolase/glucose-6-phosphate isomerase
LGTQLKELIDSGGQSIWLDNIRRSMFKSGELHRLIDAGLRGMTSNPTIFEKAIGSGNDYDEQLATLVGKDQDPNHLFEALAIDDIRHACDEFRPLYDGTKGYDGFVSLEVSPLLAADTQGTIDAAARLWKMVDRPNVMIKIPSTPECLPSITATIAAGINVNVTLIFSLETYEAVANAYIAGLEQRAAAGLPLGNVASVASVFVSRIDTAVDKMLEEKIDKGDAALKDLLGKTGVANLKLIYARFKDIFESERFSALSAKGAHVQRPLWASTGTKNPAYSDLLYVENLVGEHTVNTVPPATLDALMDHGHVRPDSVEEDLDGAHATIDALAAAHISLADVTQKLQVEGVKSFTDSYNAMLKAIEDKRKTLGDEKERVAIGLGKSEAGPEPASKRDAAPWPAQAWLEFPQTISDTLADLTSFAAETAKLFAHVVVLGVGGSALAAETLRATFGKVPTYPELHVLDATVPVSVSTLERSLDFERTLFIVASKSGTTLETEALARYFFDRVAKTVGADAAVKQFIAITDPGTPLDTDAEEAGFRRIFLNDPAIAGANGALSYFGMVPAALAGYDVRAILEKALGELHSASRTTNVEDAAAVRFGNALAGFARNGRNKLTIICHPRIAAFGAWAAYLIAAATAKNGTGIVPIADEPLGIPQNYGDDRAFVFVGAGLTPESAGIESRLAAVEAAGHPVIRLAMTDLAGIGQQFALWQLAASVAAAALHVDPDAHQAVEESKAATARRLASYKNCGAFPTLNPSITGDGVAFTPFAASASPAPASDLSSALSAILAPLRAGDYIAINAFLDRTPATEAALASLRLQLRDALKLPVTLAFGPAALHTTAHLHHTGPAGGLALVLTTACDPATDLKIPGLTTFATLLQAQSLATLDLLQSHHRPGAHLHLTAPLPSAFAELSAALDDALTAKV